MSLALGALLKFIKCNANYIEAMEWSLILLLMEVREGIVDPNKLVRSRSLTTLLNNCQGN